MKKKQISVKYVPWLNADVMHEASRNWLSELRFIKDEQFFFEDLIKSYTLQLIGSENFTQSKEIIDNLSKLQKKNKKLIETVKAHENELQIMVDGIDQIKEEETYKDSHRELIITINKYFKSYRKLKSLLFEKIKEVMRNEKRKRLLM